MDRGKKKKAARLNLNLQNALKTERSDCSQHTRRDSSPEKEPSSQNLLVVLKRDVAAHHVVQQDAKGPHGCRASVVPVVTNPLGGAVHSCAYKNKTFGFQSRDFWLIIIIAFFDYTAALYNEPL